MNRQQNLSWLPNKLGYWAHMNKKFSLPDEDDSNQVILFATNLRLEKLLQYKTKGAILRSKVRWFEHGDRKSVV